MNEHSKGSALDVCHSHEPISEVEGIDNNQGNPQKIVVEDINPQKFAVEDKNENPQKFGVDNFDWKTK